MKPSQKARTSVKEHMRKPWWEMGAGIPMVIAVAVVSTIRTTIMVIIIMITMIMTMITMIVFVTMVVIMIILAGGLKLEVAFTIDLVGPW